MGLSFGEEEEFSDGHVLLTVLGHINNVQDLVGCASLTSGKTFGFNI